jgi:hypothetical protein
MRSTRSWQYKTTVDIVCLPRAGFPSHHPRRFSRSRKLIGAHQDRAERKLAGLKKLAIKDQSACIEPSLRAATRRLLSVHELCIRLQQHSWDGISRVPETAIKRR